MRVERLPGTANVVRFPVERRARPTLELMREMAPDVREVLALAEAFGLDVPVWDLRARVDEETARTILDQFGGGVASGALDGLLDPVVVAAVTAARAAHDQAVEAADAQLMLRQAEASGHFWLDPLRDRADASVLRLAELMIEAHGRVEAAEGAARAVGPARRGEAWAPRDLRAEEDALLAIGARARSA